jgi:hypothetical protein
MRPFSSLFSRGGGGSNRGAGGGSGGNGSGGARVLRSTLRRPHLTSASASKDHIARKTQRARQREEAGSWRDVPDPTVAASRVRRRRFLRFLCVAHALPPLYPLPPRAPRAAPRHATPLRTHTPRGRRAGAAGRASAPARAHTTLIPPAPLASGDHDGIHISR